MAGFRIAHSVRPASIRIKRPTDPLAPQISAMKRVKERRWKMEQEPSNPPHKPAGILLETARKLRELMTKAASYDIEKV